MTPKTPGRRRSASGTRETSTRGRQSTRTALPPKRAHINPAQTQPAITTDAGEGKLRIVVIGGCEEVGRNMTMFEYGKDIIIIDMGLQFPEEDMPGIDYIIPNITYLKGKEKRIKGVIITHAHYDHIGSTSHLIPELGCPPMYGLPLTNAIIKKRQDDYRTAPLDIHDINIDDKLTFGVFNLEFFHLNHNIPDSMGVIIRTPCGMFVHTGDWKFDFTPSSNDKPADLAKIALTGSEGVTALLCDSTNAGQAGHQLSEFDIGKTLEGIIGDTKSRVITGTFASLLMRIAQIIEIAERHGKKVALDGFSLKSNVEIAKQLGYIKADPKTFIDIRDVEKYPPEKIIICCTGAQGERNAALMRIAHGEHRFVKLMKGDTVIFSSSVIPGNERTVQRLKDTLFRKGAEVFHYQMMDVHAGGHARNEDIKLMIRLLNPKYFVPIEGNHFMLRYNAKVAKTIGFPDDNIFIPDNGQIMEFSHDGTGVITKEKIESDYVFVDGLGISDESNIVLRDRQLLAADGMIVIIVTLETRTGKLTQNPDIISRGFIFLKENRELIEDVRHKVKKLVLESDPMSWADSNGIKNKIRDFVGQFLFTKTHKRPMILPVVIEV